ncbi:CRAL/TRIO domain-containing protein [Metschnikowia bicuspidata var. bicuspidata NRRL YB-4993]|uniref:CRAL/TRIO domain-containing protein n=1 Tax=Metschnikowia bicuspidata var. bicuspidata NRRL YB-4993 TaxID=869754 RepID=A0A1A0H7T7_9ASCO|nr:CRAL/TRIO domain-containing protein [Metschnikowia bicuspidata var. bicuspidata NRRL YB-4993]OBA19963.1 CRAL/TRIO domain-containing protein [Metschnikowia bicuspidata var. bicuspidata NRRL YB-4993]
MSTNPPVYPSNIKHRPGRIQSLESEQEIVLKQCWATLLIHWGYAVDLTPDDIRNKNAFVVSSVISNRAERHSSAITEPKKKKSYFSKKLGPEPSSKRLSDTRTRALRENHFKYKKVLVPSRDTVETFAAHSSESLANNCVDAEDASLVSFQTASDSLDGTLVDFSEGNARKTKILKTEMVDPKSQKPVFPFLADYKPSEIHSCFVGTLKNDLIDNFILRFVRARKNNCEETVKMLVKSLNWRKHDVAVEELLREGDAPSVVTGENPGFVKNFMVNKAFIRGQDRDQNPLFIFQSRKHFALDSDLAGTERYALLIIEWCRLFLREVNESVDLCSLMFDLSGFSLKNADNAPVKFLTSIFEAHYPESLGVIIVHNAPWIFSTVWNIIKNWLDPVVASKIHFTKSFDDLQKFVEPKYIPKYLGGDDQRELTYHEPGPEHTLPSKPKDARYYELKMERDEILLRIIETTKYWVCSTDREASSRYLKDKIYLSYQLSDNYIALDPYVRNPGVYDRDGTLEIRN